MCMWSIPQPMARLKAKTLRGVDTCRKQGIGVRVKGALCFSDSQAVSLNQHVLMTLVL